MKNLWKMTEILLFVIFGLLLIRLSFLVPIGE